MKIKKLSLSVALGCVLTANSYADTTAYASLRFVVQNLDTGGANDALDIEDRLSRFGIKASSTLDNGASIFGRIEYGVRTQFGEFVEGDEGANLRHAHVGFKGDFGKITLGTQTTLFHKFVRGSYFSDGLDSLRHGAIREEDLVQYTGKSGAFKYGIEASLNDETDGEDVNHYTTAASYGNKKVKIQVANIQDVAGTNQGDLTGVRGWAYFGPLTLSAFYHDSSEDFDTIFIAGTGSVTGGNITSSAGINNACANQGRDTTGIYGSYKFGSNQIHARYANLECDGANGVDIDSTKIEYVSFLSKKARVWLAYEDLSTNTGTEPSLFEAGVRYDF